MRRFAKPVYAIKAYRGFESRPLRYITPVRPNGQAFFSCAKPSTLAGFDASADLQQTFTAWPHRPSRSAAMLAMGKSIR